MSIDGQAKWRRRKMGRLKAKKYLQSQGQDNIVRAPKKHNVKLVFPALKRNLNSTNRRVNR